MYLLLAAALTLQFCGPGGCPPDAPSSSHRSAHTYTYQPVTVEKYWKTVIDPNTHKRRRVLGFNDPDAGGVFSWWEADQPERPPSAEIGPPPELPRPSPQAPITAESRFLPDQGVDRPHTRGETTIRGSDAEAIRGAQDVLNNKQPDPPSRPVARSSIDWPQVIFAIVGGVLAMGAIPLIVRRLQT